MSLLDYWDEHPPTHILVQGIASGLAGQPVGKQTKSRQVTATTEVPRIVHEPKHIESAEELAGILGGAGMNFSTFTLPKSAKPPEKFNG